MKKYLVDANLPYYFKPWTDSAYLHQIDLNPKASDKDIWAYAKEHGLTIITKDSDFSNRIMLEGPPPSVIHIKAGNMKMREFHAFIEKVWEQTLSMSSTCKLVNVYADRIEGIS